jgi:hypothetical protein
MKLLSSRGGSFCAFHENQFGNQCRIRVPPSEGNNNLCKNARLPGGQACQEHKSDWDKYVYQHSRQNLAGMKRKLQRPAETLAWNTEVTENVQPHDEEAPEVPRKHYFGPAQFYCVETICAPCGVIIGWDKFAKSESPTKILNFLNKMYPTEDTRPDYICIDKACMVLQTAATNNAWDVWKRTTRFIVDAYHYNNHSVLDILCRTWCNPAPSDGSAPNLVIIARDKFGKPYLKRAFNTQACEQLNSWLGGFESILKRMTVGNFDWFLHTMLFYHTRYVIEKQQRKQEKERKKAMNVDDSEGEDEEEEQDDDALNTVD